MSSKNAEFPLSESVAAMIRFTHLAFARHLQEHLAGHGIPVGMWFYLRALWEEDGIMQNELSRRVRATEATTALQLVKMEQHGYVERRRSETDRRNSHVYLTATGRALKGRLLRHAKDVNAMALADLSAEEVALLKDLLARIRASLEPEAVEVSRAKSRAKPQAAKRGAAARRPRSSSP
jgi:DNA-binding MarR family transcriptional regulator